MDDIKNTDEKIAIKDFHIRHPKLEHVEGNHFYCKNKMEHYYYEFRLFTEKEALERVELQRMQKGTKTVFYYDINIFTNKIKTYHDLGLNFTFN